MADLQPLVRLRPDRRVPVPPEPRLGFRVDRRGALRGLPWITAQALTDAGMSLYQDATILDPHGSLQMIAGRTMRASRKLTRLHQYLIVACKGDPRRASRRLREEP